MPSVLVVDDSPLHRAMVRDAMAFEGWTVVEAEDARQAIGLAHSPFDVILLDYVLPDLDGLLLMRELQRAGVRAPIVAFTAQGSEDIASRFLTQGAVDYLPKDKLTPLRLVHTLRNAAQFRSGLATATSAGPHAPDGDEGGPWTTVSTRGARALVADDTRLFRKTARDALEADGWVVDEAEDGPTAVKMAREQGYDLVLLDFLLSGLDGTEVLDAFRREGLPGAVVACTAHGDETVAARFLKGGAVDFVSKAHLTSLRLRRTARNALWVYSLGGTS